MFEAFDAERGDKFCQQRECILERIEIGDLAADMHVHAGCLDAGKLARQTIKRNGARERHAEFVLGFPGCDLVMGFGIDIRVDAKRQFRARSLRRSDLAQQSKLGLGLDVESEDAFLQREGHLLAGLADAGEHDLLRGDIDGERAAKLALGDDIHAGAGACQSGKHAEIGIGLDRIADERVGPGEGLGEDAIMPLKRRGRIAIEGRADRGGEVG